MEPTQRQHNNWYGISALQKERQCAQEWYNQNIQGLGPETLQTLAEIQGTASLPTNDADMATVNDFDSDDWEDIIPNALQQGICSIVGFTNDIMSTIAHGLEDEPPLQFSCMFVIDGNNSLKRVAMLGGRHVGNVRIFNDSDYYLSSKFVNQYANEVKKLAPPSGPSNNLTLTEPDKDDGTLISSPDNARDPTNGIPHNAPHTPCAENWKAAANESNKKMWAIFDETVHQIKWPQSHVTRYMLKYCQRVFINLFFCQWDGDKYANLASMLYNNYKQALRIINVDGPELKHVKETFEVQEGDLERWRLEQKEYFLALGQEPEGHALKIAYVERL
ncbi:hypothetical protein C0992_007749 [Termitomyces sp. T32_za158]|nr:hypothetical protein C0992_007749 [Termitomyces sp. T32_za158]